MLPVIIKDQALADMQKAYGYLESKEVGLGEKLLARIDDYIEVIEFNPLLFKVGYKQVRQIRVKPFKYILHYKIYKDYIAVIQLFQGNQHPNKKML